MNTLFGPRDVGSVLMDPPWMEAGGGQCQRGANRHYDLVPTAGLPQVIRSCPHWERLADMAHLYMWVTNNFLCNGDGLWLAKQLGFRPITLLTWAKPRMGIGQYFRGQTEHVIFAVRGATRLTDGTWSTLLGGKVLPHPTDEHGRIIHSRKPALLHELIEQASPGRHLEIFARQRREGWLTWGNELEEEP